MSGAYIPIEKTPCMRKCWHIRRKSVFGYINTLKQSRCSSALPPTPCRVCELGLQHRIRWQFTGPSKAASGRSRKEGQQLLAQVKEKHRRRRQGADGLSADVHRNQSGQLLGAR